MFFLLFPLSLQVILFCFQCWKSCELLESTWKSRNDKVGGSKSEPMCSHPRLCVSWTVYTSTIYYIYILTIILYISNHISLSSYLLRLSILSHNSSLIMDFADTLICHTFFMRQFHCIHLQLFHIPIWPFSPPDLFPFPLNFQVSRCAITEPLLTDHLQLLISQT